MRKLFQFILTHLRITELLNNQYEIKKKLATQQTEILKGLIYNNTIADSAWLKFKSISPGVWAADYGLLYTIYRVLNGMKPQSVLEFGLGQSSKLIHQYSNYYKVPAITCEHDEQWVNFFNEGKDGDYNITIKKVELEKVKYKGFETLSIRNQETLFGSQKFDFILVDAPFESEHFSRSQILSLVKHNLASRFCIIIDDSERKGEQETITELKNIMKENDIKYCCKEYSSSKRHYLLASPDLHFLTSL